MDKKLWYEIESHYNAAKKCLVFSDEIKNWSRNEFDGFFYMWSAYNLAKNSQEKDFELYVKILLLIDSEYKMNKYNRFHNFIKPAYDICNEFNYANNSNYEYINRLYNQLAYELSNESNNEKSYSYIKGLNLFSSINFEDGKIVNIEQVNEDLFLNIQKDETIIRLNFKNVYNIELNGDPKNFYISNFYCFPDFYRPHLLYFDIDYCKVLCEDICVVKDSL